MTRRTIHAARTLAAYLSKKDFVLKGPENYESELNYECGQNKHNAYAV